MSSLLLLTNYVEEVVAGLCCSINFLNPNRAIIIDFPLSYSKVDY